MKNERQAWMAATILALTILFVGTLAACGNDTPDDPHQYENEIHNENVNSYLVQADGVVYRCFDTGYKGGIWCTVQPKVGLN